MDNYEEEASFDAELEDEFDYGDDTLSPEEEILNSLTAEEKRVYEVIQQKLRMTDPILQALEDMKDKPSEAQIQSFKERTGDEVYFISLSEKENFLFRPIRRQEWRTLMSTIAKLDDFKKSEAIVAKGTLHPVLSNVNIGALSAGTVDTLKEVILRASNFMPPDMAVSLVRKL